MILGVGRLLRNGEAYGGDLLGVFRSVPFAQDLGRFIDRVAAIARVSDGVERDGASDLLEKRQDLDLLFKIRFFEDIGDLSGAVFARQARAGGASRLSDRPSRR